MRQSIVALGLLAAPALGCMGVYVEGQATFYPSMKYNEKDQPDPASKIAPGSGSGAMVGINLGVQFEGERSGRFAMGYVAHATTVPGGKTTGGYSDARFDIKLARIGKGRLLRLGLGFGLGSGGTTTVSGPNGDVSSKGGGGNAYGGLAVAQYFGKRHEVNVGAFGSYGAFSAPNGSFSGPGVGLKITYGFQFGDTRPGSSIVVPLDTTKNLMRDVTAAAKRAGCTAEYDEFRDVTSSGKVGLVMATVTATCEEGKRIRYDQIEAGIVIVCQKMEDEECDELNERITGHLKDKEPEVPHSTAAPTPAPSPAPTPAPPPAPPSQ